ncbi:MAG: hypothetical protein CL489_10665 [Acidobacteria bacterium]|nr:hypothetical protein [Acidobacteriota bacterium]
MSLGYGRVEFLKPCDDGYVLCPVCDGNLVTNFGKPCTVCLGRGQVREEEKFTEKDLLETRALRKELRQLGFI